MARLRCAAEEAGTDVSAVVRRLISEYFGYGTEQLQTALARQTALEAETRKVIDRVKVKIAQVETLTAEEPVLDRTIERYGGDPGECGRMNDGRDTEPGLAVMFEQIAENLRALVGDTPSER